MSVGTTFLYQDDSSTFVSLSDVGDECSVLVTASVTLEMWPSDPSCPPTRAQVELYYTDPNENEYQLDEHWIVAPPYTVPGCDDTSYPVKMNVALVGRVMVRGDWEDPANLYYKFWLKITYYSTGLDGVITAYGKASMIIGLFPCQGYAPT